MSSSRTRVAWSTWCICLWLEIARITCSSRRTWCSITMSRLCCSLTKMTGIGSWISTLRQVKSQMNSIWALSLVTMAHQWSSMSSKMHRTRPVSFSMAWASVTCSRLIREWAQRTVSQQRGHTRLIQCSALWAPQWLVVWHLVAMMVKSGFTSKSAKTQRLSCLVSEIQ